MKHLGSSNIGIQITKDKQRGTLKLSLKELDVFCKDLTWAMSMELTHP